MREIELVEDDLGHHADASPKIAKGMAKVLSANRTGDRWAPRFFLLLWRLVEYSSATLFCKLDDLFHGLRSLVVDDVLDVASVSWYIHYVQ